MSQFKFRLATLLRLREATRDERRGQLAEAYAAEQTLNDRRRAIESDLSLHVRMRKQAAVGVINVDQLLDSHRFQMVLRAELLSIEHQAALLAEEIERRREALVAADRDVRVLEKLREKQRERFNEQAAALEAKRLDDFAQRMPPVEGAHSWAS